jgi:monofunctional biosynthetic peptidoglycan transglycosylase
MARRKKTKSRQRRWLIRAAIAALFLVGISFLMVLPLIKVNPPTTAFMLQDASGRDPLLHEWVTWQVMGTAAPLAVVASEDQRFADHFGVDLKAIRRSLDERDQRGQLRGASTLSQQTVKNLYLWPGRSYLRKGLEAWLTIIAEICLPKKRILEIYLNIAEFGPGIYGIAAASEYYFGKSPATLSDREAAILAAVLPNPSRLRVRDPSDHVRERQRWILSQMARLRREDWITRIG